ncbi:hypothetical protein EVAR_32746_1 [Eumeta japonica]|uniref:Uncharacterized protein n=1 Tax=Eumeta variegata TaxID=151549 RepID=A0A4C1XM87_EUMVA|nr:hypothetical protein EVAR_32746_1 [Eumeta japonica]
MNNISMSVQLRIQIKVTKDSTSTQSAPKIDDRSLVGVRGLLIDIRNEFSENDFHAHKQTSAQWKRHRGKAADAGAGGRQNNVIAKSSSARARRRRQAAATGRRINCKSTLTDGPVNGCNSELAPSWSKTDEYSMGRVHGRRTAAGSEGASGSGRQRGVRRGRASELNVLDRGE